MPTSILVPALIFILTGAGTTYAGSRSDALSLLVWIGIGAMTAGVALLLRKKWGRTLASMIIFVGYVACGVVLLSIYSPTRRSGIEDHLFLYFLGVFAAVAFLTILSGTLWSRSSTSFLAFEGAERR